MRGWPGRGVRQQGRVCTKDLGKSPTVFFMPRSKPWPTYSWWKGRCPKERSHGSYLLRKCTSWCQSVPHFNCLVGKVTGEATTLYDGLQGSTVKHKPNWVQVGPRAWMKNGETNLQYVRAPLPCGTKKHLGLRKGKSVIFYPEPGCFAYETREHLAELPKIRGRNIDRDCLE